MSQRNGKQLDHELLAEYAEACDYPGRLDEREVESQLALYLVALGVKREIVRLRAGWTLSDHPSLRRYIAAVIRRMYPAQDALVARAAQDAQAALAARDAEGARDALAAAAAQGAGDALAAQDALDALDARAAQAAQDAEDALDALDARNAEDALAARNAQAALHRFTAWCVQAHGWWFWRFDLSWLATIYIGSLETGNSGVKKWSAPVYRAFLAGAWLLHWTEDTLYWVAKPEVHKEEPRRLHCADGPALRSDVEDLYFWHGVLVPAFAVTRPGWITVKHILSEQNAEVRRVLIERYDSVGEPGRFMLDAGAKVLDSAVQPMRAGQPEAINELLSIDLPGDPEGRMVAIRVIDPSTGRAYLLRVHPELRPMLDGQRYGEPQQMFVRNAIASTFGMRGEEYILQQET